MVKKVLLLSIVALIILTGCSNTNDINSIYGYIKGDKYINKELGFSIDIPQNWIVNENIEELNDKIPEELGSTTVVTMTDISMEGISSSTEHKQINYIGTMLLDKYRNKEQYANEQFEFDFGIEEANCKDMIDKNINGKDYIILKYKDSTRYVTMSGDKVLVFTTIGQDDMRVVIDKSIESIKFK